MRKLNFDIAKLALPLILSNLTVPLLGLTNIIVVGHLSHSYYLGAVGLGTMIFNFLYWGFGFLRMGTTGLIAQAHGQQNYKKINNIISHSVLIALTLATLLLVLQIPIEKIAFLLIGGTEKVRFYTQEYYFVRIWAAPAALLNYVLIGTFIGLQNTRAPLFIMLIINVVAIVLDILLVFQFGMAANGVALADVVAQYLGMIMGIILLLRLLKSHLTEFQFNIRWEIIKKLMSANRDIFIRTICLILAFSFFTAQSAKLGVTILAANTILLEFQMITGYALDGFLNVAEALVGKYMGKQDFQGLKNCIIDILYWTVVIGLGFVILYYFAGNYFINWMTSLPKVQIAAQHYLIYMVIFPIIAIWCFLFDGIFIGANFFSQMRNTMIIAVLCYLATWLMLREYANAGLWIAFLSFFAYRGLTMLWVLWKKRFLLQPIERVIS